MANDFKIVISATDKTTNVVRKINNEFSKTVRPLVNIHRSAAALGREIGRNPIAKGLTKISRVAVGVAGSIAKIAAPMAAIVGIGSIAGVAALATGWARLGFDIKNTSASIGITTSDLQSWRGAAKLAGISTEQMTQSMASFASTLQDAAFNRNPEAREMLRILGITLHKTSTGAIDTTRAMMDLAKVLDSPQLRGKSQEQSVVARALGAEGMLPLIRKGAEEVRKLQKDAGNVNPLKSIDAINAAEAFSVQLSKMGLAIDGLQIAIGSALMPVLRPLVEQFTNFISVDAGKWAKDFGESMEKTNWKKVGADLMAIGRAIASVVEGIVALINAMEKLNKNPAKYALGGVPRILFDLLSGDPGSQSSGGKIKPAPTGTAAAGSTGSGSTGAGSRGIRNNNPGNLREWGNTPQKDGYAIFPTPEAGLTAMIKNLQKQQSKHGLNTISSIIQKWAPPEENDTAAYIRAMEKETGFGANQPLDLRDKKTIAPLVSGIIKQEGNSSGFSQDMINRAVANAGGGKLTMTIEGLPAGVSARIRNQAGESVPVQTRMPMPAFGG